MHAGLRGRNLSGSLVKRGMPGNQRDYWNLTEGKSFVNGYVI